MNNQVIQIKSTSIMTQWKSLGKNVKEDEQQQKKWFCKHPQAAWIVQMFLEQVTKLGSRPFKES